MKKKKVKSQESAHILWQPPSSYKWTQNIPHFTSAESNTIPNQLPGTPMRSEDITVTTASHAYRAGGTSGDCLTQNLHERVVENGWNPLPSPPGLEEGLFNSSAYCSSLLCPAPRDHQVCQLCAGKERHALMRVKNTPGRKDTDLFYNLQRESFPMPLVLFSSLCLSSP